MGLRIYHDDKEMRETQEPVLFEGQGYIVDLADFSEKEKKNWIEKERLNKFIQYIPNNDFAKISFTNVVGNVNLFGKNFDVRSLKLYDGIDGNNQFKSLVDDLNKISSKLNISHTGVSSNRREVDKESFNPSDLERFDYFYQLSFSFPQGSSFESLLNQILYSPNKRTISFNEDIEVSKSKYISRNFISKLSKTQHYTKISEEHSLFNSSLVQKIRNSSGKNLLPHKVQNVKKKESFDTVENRFIKFFLEDIKSVCLRLKQQVEDTVILSKIIELKEKVESFLFLPFFKEIGRLNYIPDSSSVLLNKAGYRELYFHFVQSKFGFTSIVKELDQNAMKSGLKDMASLYEIWVFFELGKRIFGEEKINQEFETKSIKNGDVVRGVSWSSKNIQLKFNYTFSRANKSSYSLALRPDITLKVDEGLYLFDAKYKFRSIRLKEDSEEIQRIIKSQDIHKMHAYLDAVEGAVLSVAIYPGDTYVFYNKTDGSVAKSINETSFKGVGAIPLCPNSDSEQLDNFIESLISTLKS